ncbi:MAG: lipocalin-like domain-containing protein [Gemmatimonadetes bacterium]|nr:lipocalin-like domain-containing protein [Gemmatimonadota bacterium]
MIRRRLRISGYLAPRLLPSDRRRRRNDVPVRGRLRQTWVGTDQVRGFELIGSDRLSLTARTPGDTDFSVNYVGANVLIWERIR